MGMQRQYNNSLHLSFPDGFHVMDYDERKNLKMIEEGPGECLTNPEKHIIISIGWKELSFLPSLLVSARDASDNAQKAIQSAMQPYGLMNASKKLNAEQDRHGRVSVLLLFRL